jgi:hypothetical protein
VTVQVIERIARAAPVGVRLHDVVTGRSVADDIEVRILAERRGPVTAFRTRSGVFAAHGLHGLRAFESPDVAENGELDTAPIVPLPFRIEVTDRSGRYFSFVVGNALLPSDGLLTVPCGSPPASPPGSPPEAPHASLPLFSRPGRPVPASTAAVRSRLLYDTGEPAVHAALEVVPPPGLAAARGIADERGEVLVMFPYPKPPGFAGSPPAGTKSPLRKTKWTVSLHAFVPRVSSPPEEGALPELCTLLDQLPASLVATASPPSALGEATVEYGRETVLNPLVVGA